MRKDISTKDRIIAAANRLFYREGIRAVSVDAVAAAAGLTKRSLYYHFKSKDDLISDYLAYRGTPNLKRYAEWYEQADGDIADRIASIFEQLALEAARPQWKGCGFLRTAAELVDQPGHPALKIGANHKKEVEAWFANLLSCAGSADAEEVARQISLLIDGAFSQVMLYRDPVYMRTAGKAARTLIRQTFNA